MQQVDMTLVAKDGTDLGTTSKSFEDHIPEVVTKDGRVFVLRKLTAKEKAHYREVTIYNMNGG